MHEIYTYGSGETFKGVFDAIAMLTNNNTGSLIQGLKTMGGMLGVFWAVIYGFFKDYAALFTGWVIPATAVTTVFLAPSTSIWIHDPVTHYHEKVDNVPYGLAAFAGFVSKMGHRITEQVDKVFSLPDDLQYSKTGALFGSEILQSAKTFQITNPDLAANMRDFVGQCVVLEAFSGRRYTEDDLKHTDDIWRLVSENAAQSRGFMWRQVRDAGAIPGMRTAREAPRFVTCRESVPLFNAQWDAEITSTAQKYGERWLGRRKGIDVGVLLRSNYLPTAYRTLAGISKNGNDIMKQQMMIYATVDGIDSASVAVGNAPNYAVRRAHLQQRASYETMGLMANKVLISMKAVLEAIAYSCFIFVIPLAFLPFGYRFILNWAQTLLWLQMWAPLYAILNFIMTISAKSKTIAGLSLSNSAGVTIASSVGLAEINTDISAMAGYISMSIPFLSIALVRGVGSFVHMASHIGGVGQGAATSAANEITSGNLSYGNIHEGNVQVQNNSQFQNALSPRLSSGNMSIEDGRNTFTTNPNGQVIANVSNSNTPLSVNMQDSLSQQFSKSAEEHQTHGNTLSESASQNMQQSVRNMASLSEKVSESINNGTSDQLGITSDQSTAIQNATSLAEKFGQQNNVDTRTAAQLLAGLEGGISNGSNRTLNASGKLSGNMNIQSNSSEIFEKAQSFAKDNNYSEAYRNATTAAQQISTNTTNDEMRALASEASHSFDQSVSQAAQAQKSYATAESFREQASQTRNQSATISQNQTQNFLDWMAKQPADYGDGQIGYRHATYVLAQQPNIAKRYADMYAAEQVKQFDPVQSPDLKGNYQRDTTANAYTPKNTTTAFHGAHTGTFHDVRERSAEIKAQRINQTDKGNHHIKNDAGNIQSEGRTMEQTIETERDKCNVRRGGERLYKETIG